MNAFVTDAYPINLDFAFAGLCNISVVSYGQSFIIAYIFVRMHDGMWWFDLDGLIHIRLDLDGEYLTFTRKAVGSGDEAEMISYAERSSLRGIMLL